MGRPDRPEPQMCVAAAAGLLLVLTAATAPSQASDKALVGRWHTEREGGVVEIHRCGPALCGRVVDGARLRANPDQRDVRNPDQALRGRKILGARVLNGFSGGPDKWTGGPLYDPETGNRAGSGTLTLVDPDTLKVRGCIAMFLCKTQTWRRAR